VIDGVIDRGHFSCQPPSTTVNHLSLEPNVNIRRRERISVMSKARHAHIVYAHPVEGSFTHQIREAFISGLQDGGHSWSVSDLYAMDFSPDLTPEEYARESAYNTVWAVPDDVAAEHAKLVEADVWVFIYPVWWTDCPARMKGWFDRVWTVGFAYAPQTVPPAEKALVICAAGHTVEQLRESGCYQAMETVMLVDRMYERAKEKEFVVLGGSEELKGDAWERLKEAHLSAAYELGKGLI
jgi:NAD(P)H dehydrogenase (quinone)